MKKKISILVIDDANQSVNIRALKIKLRRICEPEVESICTTDISLREKGSGHLDCKKLYNHIWNTIKGKHFDWIATDYNLGEDKVDGIDIIREIAFRKSSGKKRGNKRKNVLLYSGNIEQAIEKVIDECGEDGPKYKVVSAVKSLYELPIVDFVSRDTFQEALFGLVSDHCEPTMDEEFLRKLNEHRDLTFNSCYPDFRGKKLGDIADIIESGSDARSNEWKRALIEQTIAYLVRVNG